MLTLLDFFVYLLLYILNPWNDWFRHWALGYDPITNSLRNAKFNQQQHMTTIFIIISTAMAL